MRRYLVSALMAAVIAPPAGAQLSRGLRSTAPTWFISGSVAALNGQGVNDGASMSSWDFGQRTSWQFRGTLEKAVQNESSIGVAVTHVHAPFTYRSGITPVTCPVNADCVAQTFNGGVYCGACSAHLDMESVMAMFHAGGGLGFHQVIELGLGASVYRNLTRDSDGKKMAPVGSNWDPTFTLGYGYGYGLSPQTEVVFVGDYAVALHENKNLPSDASNTNSLRTLRFGIRYGFGAARPGVRRGR